MQRLSADWVLPVSAPPIQHGAVLIADNGRILAVGSDAVVPRPEIASSIHLNNTALLPGLVNTHTHLELTGFAGMVEEDLFLDWIRKLIVLKAARSAEEFFLAARRGIHEMWATGVTTICDTGSTGAVIAALDDLGASGIAHHEVFGMHPEQGDTAIKAFARDLDRLARHATGRTGIGVSPHAPYTVSGQLYQRAGELARANGVPLAVHVAEPQDESALLADFTGSFAEWWQELGTPRPTSQPISPMAWLEQHEILSPRTLCVHAIHVSQPDTDLMVRHGVAVAHCPRSNRRHHGADAPVGSYLDRGLRLGLGTDSEVSVAPPDLRAEARAARLLTNWSAAETVAALTLGGAGAIDRDDDCGSLTVGKWADMVAIEIGETDKPYEAVLGELAPVTGTWLAGRKVFGIPD
jgi:5-methylthioadenosine/S-adenosylhomocysteine deaminase